MYDAIVIGARCAGAPTAMLLARRGFEVLLVDRGTFPSEIPHGHFIHSHGPRRLHRWGLLDRVVATGCPAVTSVTMDFDDFPLTGRGLSVDGVAMGYGPRRAALDNVLVEAAVEAGAELREGFVIEDLATDGERVVGVRGRDKRAGATTTERARVTVGADGRNSRLARIVRAPVYEAVPALTCWYFSYWEDVPDSESLEMYLRERHIVFAFPTNHDRFAVFIGWPIEEFYAVRSDVEGSFLAALDRVPALAERVLGGRRIERFYGTANVPNFLRKPYGPGWALVGDAGCHKDPYLALGVCDALRDAELLTEALDEGLSGERPLDAALADYERQRNEATLPEYRQNLELARLQPPPAGMMQLRAALRGDQGATDRFFMAREGMIPHEAFFNPEYMGRILAKV